MDVGTYLQQHNLLAAVGTAADFPQLYPVLLARNASLRGFAEPDIFKRLSPQSLLPGARTMVMVAVPYKKQMHCEPDSALRGIISQSAVGEDYHRLLGTHLEALAGLWGLTEYKIFVDTGPLVERAVAQRLGLGICGKNQSLITARGGMVFLGGLLTTAEVPPLETPAPPGGCGDCTACLRACPTGALTGDGFVMERCVSYLTQKKGLLTRAEMAGMGRALYGCDVCSLACPHNQKEPGDPFFDREAAFPELRGLLELSENEFRQRFGGTAAGWRGRRVLQRNALIALFHQGADIRPYLNHPAQLVRETARRLREEEE